MAGILLVNDLNVSCIKSKILRVLKVIRYHVVVLHLANGALRGNLCSRSCERRSLGTDELIRGQYTSITFRCPDYL